MNLINYKVISETVGNVYSEVKRQHVGNSTYLVFERIGTYSRKLNRIIKLTKNKIGIEDQNKALWTL